MSSNATFRVVQVDDRSALQQALEGALAGGVPVLPIADEPPNTLAQLQALTLPPGTAVLVHTSGSTGVPKTVALSADALIASAQATHEALGGPGQWLVALPTHLISGLQMIVRGIVAQAHPLFAPSPFDPQTFIDSANLMQHERRYVSLVPVQLSRLIDFAETDDEAARTLARFDAILVGGASTPLQLRQRAHELGISLRLSYGMTETAGGCVYDGVEIGDTRVRIRDGEVQLSGSTLALGYLGDPDVTAARFIEDAGVRWYRTGDTGQLLGGMLQLTGRRDRVIISGGVNVSLDEVERVVHELPGWQSAVALAAPGGEWGERVSLVREILTDSTAAGNDTAAAEAITPLPFSDVCETVRAQLGPAAVPVWVNEIGEIPRLQGGKPDLVAITTWVTDLRQSFRTLGAEW